MLNIFSKKKTDENKPLDEAKPGTRNVYKIEVDCPNCANQMEFAAKNTDGVVDATVNFMTQKMSVVFEDGVNLSEVMKGVKKNCKKVADDGEIFI